MMTSVPSTTAATGATATTASASTASATDNALSKTSADFNFFLKMLTTQMQNQDPLKPMDSTEYTQQIAQYSQVEQTIQQTSALKDMLAQMSTQSVAQASGFIGRAAEFDTAVSGLTAATPARWSFDAPAGATTLTGKITDTAGRVYATPQISVADAQGRFEWDGKLPDGSVAPAGAYKLALTTETGTEVTPRSRGTIADVQSANNAVTLGVNGVQTPLSKLVRVAS